MSDMLYYILCAALVAGVLAGISMMSKVKTAAQGNMLSAVCMGLAIGLTLYKYGILSEVYLWATMAVGLVCGIFWAGRIKMIEMPQVVALLNGFGGAASALVAAISMLDGYEIDRFGLFTGGIALAVGGVTLTGSLVAAGKLHKVLSQKSVVWKNHQMVTTASALVSAALVVAIGLRLMPLWPAVVLCAVFSGFFGVAFAIRVGGADMPITISLLNSLSGVAGAIAGMAIGDPLLVAIGGVVGASGLLLTQIMCKAMNRALSDILLGKTSAPAGKKAPGPMIDREAEAQTTSEKSGEVQPEGVSPLINPKRVIIVPGYGMALAQAQQLVKQVADKYEAKGAVVDFAIHPVAGRMPGHMNVLLAEADVPYEKLREMDDINPEFEACDLAVIIGANDVVNPAANSAEDTPIYGMPILDVEKAGHILICNYDDKPGYAGVDNPLYKAANVTLMLGDAAQTLKGLLDAMDGKPVSQPQPATPEDPASIKPEGVSPLINPKRVIIVPGYGMALAQAQQLVKQVADKYEAKGAVVDFAIHPVAGRMPGHMNVLLAEADVPYEKLREMDDINPEFEACDLAVIIGANDVVNPAANSAEDTPIYGMPILDVEKAGHILICNYDDKPGYAGVDNPLYKAANVTLMLGDAAQTLNELLSKL